MGRRAADRAAGAALALSLLIWAAALGTTPRPAAEASVRGCPTGWRESAHEGGVSVRVACRARAGGEPVRGPARLLVGLPIQLNRASARTLEVLPRIGPSRAAAIVEARCRAAFRRLEDLERVPGIGPVTVAGLRGRAVAGPPAPECPGAPTLPP